MSGTCEANEGGKGGVVTTLSYFPRKSVLCNMHISPHNSVIPFRKKRGNYASKK